MKMMEFIKMEFPLDIFLPKSERHSFYDDVLPSERIEATGFFQPPMVWNSDSAKSSMLPQH